MLGVGYSLFVFSLPLSSDGRDCLKYKRAGLSHATQTGVRSMAVKQTRARHYRHRKSVDRRLRGAVPGSALSERKEHPLPTAVSHAGHVCNLSKVPDNLLLLCVVRHPFQTGSALAVVGLRERLSSHLGCHFEAGCAINGLGSEYLPSLKPLGLGFNISVASWFNLLGGGERKLPPQTPQFPPPPKKKCFPSAIKIDLH